MIAAFHNQIGLISVKDPVVSVANLHRVEYVDGAQILPQLDIESVKELKVASIPVVPIGIAVAKLGTDVETYVVELHEPQVFCMDI